MNPILDGVHVNRKVDFFERLGPRGVLHGAAGGVEAIFSILALRDRVLPPTINLDEPGEGCDLDFVANVAREANIDVALSNSFGFGGTNGTLAFRRAAA